MSGDGWNEPDPNRWEPRPICQKVGCTNELTFPDYDVYCVFCIAEAEERKRKQWLKIQAYENIRRA